MNPLFGQGGLERVGEASTPPSTGVVAFALLALAAAAGALGWALHGERPARETTRVEVRREVAACHLAPFPELPPPPKATCIGHYSGECAGPGSIAYRKWEHDEYVRTSEALRDWAVAFYTECGGDR